MPSVNVLDLRTDDLHLATPMADPLDVTSQGAGIRLIKEDTVRLDLNYAQALLQLASVEAERAVSDYHVENLLNSMQRGTFRPEQVTLCTCTLDGVKYRLNGQHTCWAILSGGGKYSYVIRRHHYSCKTPADMKLLYSTIDRGMPRSRKVVVASNVVGSPGWEHVGVDWIRRLSEGLTLWLWETPHQRAQHDGNDVAYLMLSKYQNLCLDVIAFLQETPSANTKHLKRAAVLGAMLATFDKVRNGDRGSVAFWSVVRDGVGATKKDDARIRLMRALMTTSVADRVRGKNKIATSEQVHRWCLQAWNAFRRDEPLQALRALLNAPRPRLL